MSEAIKEQVERVTVYLTPHNKKRLSMLRRGEKTKKLNEALDKAFEEEERQKAFQSLMDNVGKINPAESVISSTEIIRMLREGKDHELSDLQSSS